MAQTLLIGLGGTGSRVINKVAKTLRQNNKKINDGNGEIYCAVLDTNTKDADQVRESGTLIPVIPTSKNQDIGAYVKQYTPHGIKNWCPESESFYRENMINGAAEVRMKSRIAFMDRAKTPRGLAALEDIIIDMMKHNKDQEIDIMIASSVSGGSGAGMFIQVALWLRQRFGSHQIKIFGTFLLPDVFVKTISDIGNSGHARTRHYGNAYAALRELNALTNKRRWRKYPSLSIELDDLYHGQTDGSPVYNNVILLDYYDFNGSALGSLNEYEEAAAQLIYTELYTPMYPHMKSQLDNNFESEERARTMLLCSAGAATLAYPVESVKEYCVLRATKASMSEGWTRIDDEIRDFEQAEQRRAHDDFSYTPKVYDKRYHYVKIFDEKSQTGDYETGPDHFFIELRKDIFNVTLQRNEENPLELILDPSDKVADFMELLDQTVFDKAISDSYRWNTIRIADPKGFVEKDNTEEDLRKKVNGVENKLKGVMKNFDASLEKTSNEILNRIFPRSMGTVNVKNGATIYGLLSKKDPKEDKWEFVHPIAARYMLYKLYHRLDSLEDVEVIPPAYQTVEGIFAHFKEKIDNPHTKKEKEVDALSSLEGGKGRLQSMKAFLNEYEKNYAGYINGLVDACLKYEKYKLQTQVFIKLRNQLDSLLKKFEAFFVQIKDVQKKLDEEYTHNIDETAATAGKISYVLGDPESKEAIFQELDMEMEKGASMVNQGVIEAVYGTVCADYFPSDPANAPYLEADMKVLFVDRMKENFRDKLERNAQNRANLDLDIYEAIRKQSDLKAKGGKVDYKSDRDQITASLKWNAVPMLRHDPVYADNAHGNVSLTNRTFWGVHPAVVESFKKHETETIDEWLGGNIEHEQNANYSKYELICFCIETGLPAKYVSKINELNAPGDQENYYSCYNSLITEMEYAVSQMEDEKDKEAPYATTLHLDKTWHHILPYVTDEMQEMMDAQLLRGFWLAIANDKLMLDDKNRYILKRKKQNMGKEVDGDVPVMLNGETIDYQNVGLLLEALKRDVIFQEQEIPALNKAFAEQIYGIVNLSQVESYRNWVNPRNKDLNPAWLVARYSEKRGVSVDDAKSLLVGLNDLLAEIADNSREETTKDTREDKIVRMQREIYNASGIQKKYPALSDWATQK